MHLNERSIHRTNTYHHNDLQDLHFNKSYIQNLPLLSTYTFTEISNSDI